MSVSQEFPTASGESAGDNPVAVTGGEIFWRGVYRPRESAIRLRDEFAAYTDWPDAKRYADELTKALRATTKENHSSAAQGGRQPNKLPAEAVAQ